MKAIIYIQGAISSRHTLRTAIAGADEEYTERASGNISMVFQTRKAAKKALWEAFKYLRSSLDEPRVNCIGGLRYGKQSFLAYDAATATLGYN